MYGNLDISALVVISKIKFGLVWLFWYSVILDSGCIRRLTENSEQKWDHGFRLEWVRTIRIFNWMRFCSLGYTVLLAMFHTDMLPLLVVWKGLFVYRFYFNLIVYEYQFWSMCSSVVHVKIDQNYTNFLVKETFGSGKKVVLTKICVKQVEYRSFI